MKDKLNFKYDYLPIILAIQIIVYIEKQVFRARRPSSLEDYFFFTKFFLDVSEYDVLKELATFVDTGLIKEIKATLYQSEGVIDRSVVNINKWHKDNLKRHHIVDFVTPVNESNGKREIMPFDIFLPWVSEKDLELYEQNDQYFEYELKVDLERIREWLDLRLALLHSNKFMHQAYKYDKQRALVLNHITKSLLDFVPENLHVAQFEDCHSLLFPLVIYELRKEGFLEIKEIRIVKDGYNKAVFTVDVLKNDFNSGCRAKFDKVLSLLVIDDFELPVKKESQQHYLLDAIFDDPCRSWCYSEIEDIVEGEDDLENWKRWYNVADAIRKKIAVDSRGRYEDFFVTTTNSVQVNPKYLC